MIHLVHIYEFGSVHYYNEVHSVITTEYVSHDLINWLALVTSMGKHLSLKVPWFSLKIKLLRYTGKTTVSDLVSHSPPLSLGIHYYYTIIKKAFTPTSLWDSPWFQDFVKWAKSVFYLISLPSIDKDCSKYCRCQSFNNLVSDCFWSRSCLSNSSFTSIVSKSVGDVTCNSFLIFCQISCETWHCQSFLNTRRFQLKDSPQLLLFSSIPTCWSNSSVAVTLMVSNFKGGSHIGDDFVCCVPLSSLKHKGSSDDFYFLQLFVRYILLSLWWLLLLLLDCLFVHLILCFACLTASSQTQGKCN